MQLQWQLFPFRLHRYSAQFPMIKQNAADRLLAGRLSLLNHGEEMTQFLMPLAFPFSDI